MSEITRLEFNRALLDIATAHASLAELAQAVSKTNIAMREVGLALVYAATDESDKVLEHLSLASESLNEGQSQILNIINKAAALVGEQHSRFMSTQDAG